MANVIRKTTLVNPAHRRLTEKQKLAGFGGKKAAIRTRARKAFRETVREMGRPPRSNAWRAKVSQGQSSWYGPTFESKADAQRHKREQLAKSPHLKARLVKVRQNAGAWTVRKTKKRLKKAQGKHHFLDGELRYLAQIQKKFTRGSKSRKATRRNVSAIVTAGLPFANPYGSKKGPNSMAKTHQKRRRTNASKKNIPFFKARRHNAAKRRTNPGGHHHRTKTVVKYRYRRSNPVARRHGKRSNPGGSQAKGLLVNSLVASVNAVGSRWVPQFFLGANNTGLMGYAANLGTGLVGAWVAKKFVGKSAGYAALLGLGISVLLRAAQDFTPWGSSLALSGFGDSGMGALMPMDFVNPQAYDQSGTAVRIPGSWKPAPLPAAAPNAATRSASGPARNGMGSTYSRSMYR